MGARVKARVGVHVERTIDDSKLLLALNEAYANGAAAARVSAETANDALRKAADAGAKELEAVRGENRDLRKFVMDLIAEARTHSKETAEFKFIESRLQVERMEIESSERKLGKLLEMGSEYMPHLKRLTSGMTNFDAADNDVAEGKAAFIRLFQRIAETPDVAAKLQELSGKRDWELICDLMLKIGSLPATVNVA